MLGSEGGDVEQEKSKLEWKGERKKVEEVHQQSWFARKKIHKKYKGKGLQPQKIKIQKHPAGFPATQKEKKKNTEAPKGFATAKIHPKGFE